jgi:two-component system response regulator VicR
MSLSPKEFGILGFLASRVGEVVTRDELLDEVWVMENFLPKRTTKK